MDAVATPFGGIVGLVPTYSRHGEAGQAVRGVGLHPTSSGPALACDPQWRDALPAAPVGASQVSDRGGSRADQEPVGSSLPTVTVRGRGL